MSIKLIALDLDGTLLDSNKLLSSRNRAALQAAADRGVWIVPATGRFFLGIPDTVRQLPFLRCAITINGAEVWDARTETALYRCEIPAEEAERLYDRFDAMPVMYDCYQDGWGWIKQEFFDRFASITDNRFEIDMIHMLRTSLADFRGTMRQRNRPIQKCQLFFTDPDLRLVQLHELAEQYPDLAITTSIENNIEINRKDANKGAALGALCQSLGLRTEESMAFGDGLNDVTMLCAAGMGVAMGNACEEVRARADLVAPPNDEDGVARIIEQYVL